MKNIKLLPLLALVSLLITTTGCIGVNKNFKILRNQVFDSLNENFDKTIEFSLGKSAFMFASKFIHTNEEEDENIKDMLKDVSNICIGIYEREEKNNFTESSGEILNEISDNLEINNWDSIVKVNGKDETIGIYIKENDMEEINEMFAVILSNDEMIMLKLNGDLNTLVDRVIEQQGFGIKITDRH